jgi:hypothetical protein
MGAIERRSSTNSGSTSSRWVASKDSCIQGIRQGEAMRLIGMMAVRNEEYVLGLSLRVALMWCDEVVVLLHACTDRSEEICCDIQEEVSSRVHIHVETGEWEEMRHRKFMLSCARMHGATHLAIIDADEVLSGNLQCAPWDLAPAVIRDPIGALSSIQIMELPGYNLRGGINQYHSNGVWGNRWFSTAFKDAPDLGWSGDRFHHREPGPRKLTPYRPIQQGQGGVMHLWGASERRLIAKHALYKVTEHIRQMSQPELIELTYNDYRSPADNARHWPKQTEWAKPWTYNPVPASWWAPYAHLMKYLDVDAEPWQEAEVRRLVAEYGREKFTGLDLFGVA